jgi:hypothetical protein
MPYETRLLTDEFTIEVRLWGRLPTDDIRSLAAEVLSLADETGFRRVLADCGDYEDVASLGEVYFLAEDVTERLLSMRGPQAIVAPTKTPVAANVEFYIVAARNRGSNIQMFSSRETAIQWLRDQRLSASPLDRSGSA